jgi:hypothetical protein
MKYDFGECKDIVEFNPNGDCSAGGMYFTTLNNASYYSNFGDLIATIKLPPESKVYYEALKMKADRFIIDEIYEVGDYMMNQLTSEERLKWIKSNENLVKKLDDKYITPEICDYVCEHSIVNFRYIPCKMKTWKRCQKCFSANVCRYGFTAEQFLENCPTRYIMFFNNIPLTTRVKCFGYSCFDNIKSRMPFFY